MALTPFHALYKARELSAYAYGRNKLLPVFASSDIEAYPYQIAAARFALRSPYLKGAILCDEGSLGKTYEAMLVAAQLWYEGKERILLVVPTPLLGQWAEILESRFTVPFVVLDTNAAFDERLAAGEQNPFQQEGVILTTYDFAAEQAECIAQTQWDLTVFEEAHHLRRIYTGANQSAAAIKEAVGEAFKLLLTATPMQNSILDLYGLVNFIDDSVFPDEKAFYERYFRKPENYPELAERVSKFCFRTTRQEVTTYVKIPERLPVTAEFELTAKEQELYDLLDAYLQKGARLAFPKMDRYDLALMLFRTLSSSTFALERTLRGVVRRMEKLQAEAPASRELAAELDELRRMQALAAGIKQNAKAKELLTALKNGFTQLKQLGAKQKALIFTENRTTQDFLFSLLDNGPYKGKVLAYNGSRSRDYTVMERFEKDAKILISTDIGAEGFNLEFCSFVINYDLPYNTLTIEQRINRCHRQGQQSDVIILNFLNRNNFADVRMLELINKRILQFSGIFGMSDDVIGNFGIDLGESFAKALGGARSRDEIDRAYKDALVQFEEENKRIIKQAKESLSTSFTREIAHKVDITPQYVEDMTAKINDDLWALTKYFFGSKRGFRLDDETRTLSCFAVPPKVFTGTRMGRNEYSMSKGYQPRSGRHTVTGSLARAIIHEICWQGIPERGEIVVDADTHILVEPCAIGFYQVRVKPKGTFWGGYLFYPFIGRTRSGRILSDGECREIMSLPVGRFATHGEVCGDGNRHLRDERPDELDAIIEPEAFIQRTLTDIESAEKEEIERFKAQAADAKLALERGVERLRSQVRTEEHRLNGELSRVEKLESQKILAALRKELKLGEQNLFMNGLKLDMVCEENIKNLLRMRGSLLR
ncbi:DEAD/DEAH box helicase [Desulfovibrio falkowii]|uniref:DEAD/DEAH box helicase n=1 Tax=Desulfovibrio sp. WGS1351 TaxID=3366814 RepID=UPI00372D630D